MSHRRARPSAIVHRRVPTDRKFRLRAETLEPRRLLAGDVSAVVSHGTLYITGDNADNFVEVFGTGTPGQFTVEGFTDNHGVNTKINHQTSDQTFNGVTNISVALNGGDDFFGFEGGSLAGNFNIDMGTGNDEVNMGVPKILTSSVSLPAVVPLVPTTTSISAATICGSLCINLGTGNNWLIEGSTHVKGSETVNACDGNDRIEFIDTGGPPGFNTIGSGVTVDKDLIVNLGCGSNYLDAYDLTVNGNFKVTGTGTNDVELAVLNVAKDAVFSLCGSGAQDFSLAPDVAVGDVPGIENHIGGNLSVFTGAGCDDVTESSLMVGGSNTINTDGGNDDVGIGDVMTGCGPEVDLSVTVGKNLCVNLGCGTDSLTAADVHVTGTFSVLKGRGDSTIDLMLVIVNALKITTDGGVDNVTLNEIAANSANIFLGAGNDTLSVTEATISTSTFDGGTGVNTYIDGGANFLPNLTKKHFT